MKTLEELKLVGLTCHNLVEVAKPAFWFNEETHEINYNEPFYEGQQHKTVLVRTVLPYSTLVDELNGCELIAWYPCENVIALDGQEFKWFRFKKLKCTNSPDITRTLTPEDLQTILMEQTTQP
jgi:hypothetical protein